MAPSSARIERHFGTINVDQMQSHIEHRFTVDADTTLIEIKFDYGPKRPAGSEFTHEVSLSLYDPHAGRGARHNNPDHSIVLREGYASKGYVPGPLTPGTWTVSIDVHRIVAPGQVTYDLSIKTDTAAQSDSQNTFVAATCAPRGPGWYRGDLHGHTLHSDAQWDVPDFVDYARRIGLDFATLTDHNTPSGIPECLSLAGDDLLLMGGTELTTFWGHCLAIGTRDWVDWRTDAVPSMASKVSDLMAEGVLFVIAHPTSTGHPWCSGCEWKYSDMMPGPARIIEVWNGDWSGPARNELALAMYYGWLNQGHRLVATAGSDIHAPFGPDQRPGYNVVYSEALRSEQILEGIRRGSLYLSSGPEIQVTLEDHPKETAIGASLPLVDASLSIVWEKSPTDAVIWVVGRSNEAGERCRSKQIGEGSSGTATVHIRPQDSFDWAAVEIRDQYGDLHALTNPSFLG